MSGHKDRGLAHTPTVFIVQSSVRSSVVIYWSASLYLEEVYFKTAAVKATSE